MIKHVSVTIIIFCRFACEKKFTLEGTGHKILLAEKPFTITIVTSFMQRAMSAEREGRSFFVDTSSYCNQANTVLTLVLVSSKAEAIPVGVSLHESQSENCYSQVFAHFKELLLRTSSGSNLDLHRRNEAFLTLTAAGAALFPAGARESTKSKFISGVSAGSGGLPSFHICSKSLYCTKTLY